MEQRIPAELRDNIVLSAAKSVPSEFRWGMNITFYINSDGDLVHTYEGSFTDLAVDGSFKEHNDGQKSFEDLCKDIDDLRVFDDFNRLVNCRYGTHGEQSVTISNAKQMQFAC